MGENATNLPEQQLDILVSKIVFALKEDRKKERQHFKNRAEHNTTLLLRYYHKLKAHTESVKEQLEADKDTFLGPSLARFKYVDAKQSKDS